MLQNSADHFKFSVRGQIAKSNGPSIIWQINDSYGHMSAIEIAHNLTAIAWVSQLGKLFIATTMTKINNHKYTLKSCKTNFKEAKAYNAEIRSYK